MKKLKFVFFLTVLLSLPLFAASAHAAEYVKVKLDGMVTINMQEFTYSDNFKSAYPFIKYNDIIYLPMTYSNAQMLGLESNWDEASGFSVKKRDFSILGNCGRREERETPNVHSTAMIAEFDITVNGEKINNREEEYPLLVYNNITYFPLTWRFIVDIFGWQYSYDSENGLEIISESKFRLIAGDYNEGLYYFKDGVSIYIDTGYPPRLTGPNFSNIYFTINGETKQIGTIYDNFGYALNEHNVAFNTGYIIDYEDGWIYTTWGSYWQGLGPALCKVNVESEEIVFL